MPTLIPNIEKQAFIAIVAVRNPNEALRLQSVLNYYEDVPIAIGRQQEDFAYNNGYLTAAMNTLNNINLQAAGVYYQQQLSAPLSTPPVMWINSNTNAGIVIASSPPGFAVLGSSNINKITLDPYVVIPGLYIGPGSIVDVLDGTATGSIVNYLILPFARSTPATLNTAKFGTTIGSVQVADGSYFGGYQDDDANSLCFPVTNMQATEITKNGVLVSWTPPVSSSPPILFIETSYRKTGSKVWIPVDETIGDYQGLSGFAFRCLEPDTWYDIQATVQCGNGGYSFNQITIQTTCCGAGTNMSLYKVCNITMMIGVAPSPPPVQTLCNGVSIPLWYPPGSTITIPYLATVNCNIVQQMIIDNYNYQLMPFNAATGTWDASTTPVLEFITGNVVTVGVALPA